MGAKLFFMLPVFLNQDKNQLVCNYVHPFFKCYFYEFLISGIIYLGLGGFCIFSLIQHFKQLRILKQASFDFNKWFWISISIWCIYHSIFELFYIDWTSQSYYIFYVCLDSILLLIPSSFFVIIISEALFIYRNPGIFIHMFSRILFGIFIFIFLLLGIFSACFKSIEELDTSKDDFFHLWLTCFDFLMFCFVLMPSYKLIQALSTPVVLPEDVSFIKRLKIGLFILCLLYMICVVFNILRYCHANPFYNIIKENIRNANGILDFKHRYLYILMEFLLNFDIVILLICGVKLIRQHDLSFVEDPLETQVKSDYETNNGV